MRPVFFSSIPKCGKNLVYSFFNTLGYHRHVWRNNPSAMLHHARFGRDTYAFAAPAPYSAEQLREAPDVIGRELGLAGGGGPVIGHLHLMDDVDPSHFLRAAGFQQLFVYRDPRDTLVSMLNYARVQGHPEHVARRLAGLSDEDALIFLLEGAHDLAPFAEYFDAHRGWLDRRDVLSLRFEDLIGVSGGGDEAAQRKAVGQLAALIDVPADDPRIDAARMRTFNRHAGTFHRGQIGAWRESFTPKVESAYQALAAQRLAWASRTEA